MQDHIRDLLSRFQYSEQLKETAVFRMLFGGEEVSQVMADLGIHSSYTLRGWVQVYRQKIQTGLITLPAMKTTHKQVSRPEKMECLFQYVFANVTCKIQLQRRGRFGLLSGSVGLGISAPF